MRVPARSGGAGRFTPAAGGRFWRRSSIRVRTLPRQEYVMSSSPSAVLDRSRLTEVAAYDWSNPELGARLDRICAQTASWTGAPIAVASVLLDAAQIFIGTAGVMEALVAAAGAGDWIIESGGIPV